jgi:hypothetical protein
VIPRRCDACARRRRRALFDARLAVARELDRRRPAWGWSAPLSALLCVLDAAFEEAA